MLGRYIKINNTVMPNPVTGTFSEALNPAENVYQTEDGGQASNVLRLDRSSWSATFNCSDTLKEALLALCTTPSVNVEVDGVPMSGRLRLSGDVALVANSERTEGTQGLWTVPVHFEGF